MSVLYVSGHDLLTFLSGFFSFLIGWEFYGPNYLKCSKLCAGPAASIVQELCESRGGRPGLSVLTSLLVSVDVKIY